MSLVTSSTRTRCLRFVEDGNEDECDDGHETEDEDGDEDECDDGDDDGDRDENQDDFDTFVRLFLLLGCSSVHAEVKLVMLG